MLTYAYADLNRAGLRRFYWRRFLSVGIPYLCWSVIYFLCTLPVSHYPSTTVVFKGLASIVETGYYQLYFLLVIMQFYLVFPLVLVLLRRTRGHGRDRDRYALESVLARTPLAVPLTGRTQVPWRRPRRFPPHPVVLGDQGGVEPLAQGVAGSWHA
jgi:peptidoglycan/LPS O-acetylase OafA/YrhL